MKTIDKGYFASLPVDLDAATTEKVLFEALNYIKKEDASWVEGVELLSDLMALQAKKNKKLSPAIGKAILNWLSTKYDGNMYHEFPYAHEIGSAEEKMLFLQMDCTVDILHQIHHHTDVVPFLQEMLEKSTNEYEYDRLKRNIKRKQEATQLEENTIPEAQLDVIIEKADNYFASLYQTKKISSPICAFRDLVVEHALCYEIRWISEEDKYRSLAKRTVRIGGWGPLLLSKTLDRYKMAGSTPMANSVHYFELEIQGLEEFFYFELPYKEPYIELVKAELEYTDQEIIDSCNDQGCMVFTKKKSWCDFRINFHYLMDTLQKKGLEGKLEVRRRKILTE